MSLLRVVSQGSQNSFLLSSKSRWVSTLPSRDPTSQLSTRLHFLLLLPSYRYYFNHTSPFPTSLLFRPFLFFLKQTNLYPSPDSLSFQTSLPHPLQAISLPINLPAPSHFLSHRPPHSQGYLQPFLGGVGRLGISFLKPHHHRPLDFSFPPLRQFQGSFHASHPSFLPYLFPNRHNFSAPELPSPHQRFCLRTISSATTWCCRPLKSQFPNSFHPDIFLTKHHTHTNGRLTSFLQHLLFFAPPISR